MATALASNGKAARLWRLLPSFITREEIEQSSYTQSLLAASGPRPSPSTSSFCRPAERLDKPCFRACVSEEQLVTEFIEDSPELLEVPDELLCPNTSEGGGFGLGLSDEATGLQGRSAKCGKVMGQDVIIPTEVGVWQTQTCSLNRESSLHDSLSEKDERDAVHICELISAFAGLPTEVLDERLLTLLMVLRQRLACLQPICKTAAVEVLDKPELRGRRGWSCDGTSGSLTVCNEGGQFGVWTFESKCSAPGMKAIFKSDFNCSDFVAGEWHEDGLADSIPSSMQPSFLSGNGMVDVPVEGRESDHMDLKVDMKEFYKAVGQSLTTKSTKSASTCAESPRGPTSPETSCCWSREATARSAEGRFTFAPPSKGDSAMSSPEKSPARPPPESQQLEEPLPELRQVPNLLPRESSCLNPFEDPCLVDAANAVPQISESSASQSTPDSVQPARVSSAAASSQSKRSSCGCFVGLRKKLTGNLQIADSKGDTASSSRPVENDRRPAGVHAGDACNTLVNSTSADSVSSLPHRPVCVSHLGPQSQRRTVTSC